MISTDCNAQTGGVTLTLGVAYLTVITHERNRNSQALYLRSQSHLLTSIHDTEPQNLPPSRAELSRASRETFVETAKDRWNEEIENAVHRVQTTDWSSVREGVEGTIARLLSKGLEQSREGIESVEKSAEINVQGAVDASKATASRATARTVAWAATTTRATSDTVATKVNELAVAVKSKADHNVADATTGAGQAAASQRIAWDLELARSQELKQRANSNLSNSVGTVDAAREAVRDAFGKGIEKGQELFGKAQAAVGLATEKIEYAVGEKMEGMSEIDKALKKRYEKLHGLDKTAEEVLEERYKLIDQKS